MERAREENRRLLSLIEEKDHRISTLEGRMSKVVAELLEARCERSNLRQENSALIRAMASLKSK